LGRLRGRNATGPGVKVDTNVKRRPLDIGKLGTGKVKSTSAARTINIAGSIYR